MNLWIRFLFVLKNAILISMPLSNITQYVPFFNIGTSGQKLQSRDYPFYSIRRFRTQGHTPADVLLTVTYRFEIVLGTLGLDTRGCVPARYHREALPKTSQSDLLDDIGGIRRRAICHQIPVTINICSFPPQKTARFPLSSSARFPPTR